MTRTPGTWKADVHTSNISQYPYVYSVDDQGHTIGEICRPEAPQTGGMEEAEANTRLIAAAPELLDALKGLFRECEMVHKYWGEGCNNKQANLAIAAARCIISKAEEA